MRSLWCAIPLLENEANRTIRDVAEWLSTLPMQDGDLDLETMGLTQEEVIELVKEKVQFLTWDDLLTRILTDVKALPDSTERPE